MMLHRIIKKILIHSCTGNDSEWVDIVEPELRQILELERGVTKNAGSTLRIKGMSSSSSNPTGIPVGLETPKMSKKSGSKDISPCVRSPRVVKKGDSPKSPMQSPKLPKRYAPCQFWHSSLFMSDLALFLLISMRFIASSIKCICLLM